ncbi:MAG: CvpA family protein [Defluviicoccus sp.]|nr:CvpA family protein [Defluviicoccus sp.]MDE0383212.1 CvpA family protein [Defluviicoccus sp.]
MSPLDLAVIAALVIAGLLGLWLGVVRVLLGIGSWIGAALLTVYGMPLLRPTARGWIESPFLADLAAGGVVFMAGLIVLTVLTHLIAERIRGSALGAVDRSLGLLVGLALGIAVASGSYLVVERLLVLPHEGSERPEWLRDSRTAPLLAFSARFMVSLLPPEWRPASVTGAAAAPQPDPGAEAERLMTPVPESQGTKDKPGYSKNERREMDRLFNANQ